MDASCTASMIRRAADRLASAWWPRLILLAMLALGLAGQAAAQTCDFVPIGSQTALAPAGTQVSFTFQAQTACAPTVTGTIAVTTDGTGGASIVPPTAFTALLDTDYTFQVDLGPLPGQSGTVTATCLTGGCAGQTIVYSFTTNNVFSFTPTTPAAITTNQITPFTVGTNLQLNGAPGGLAINYANITNLTNYGNQPSDTNGDSSTTQTIFIAGNYVVRASVQCPIAFVLEGCPPAPVDFAINVEPVAVTAQTSTTPSTVSGTPVAMTIRYGSASIPAPDGSNITWSVTGQPAGGDGTVSGPATSGGLSTGTFSATVPGTYTVTANSGCTFCAPGQVSFTITVAALPTLAIAGGDGQNALVGAAYALPLQVLAQDSGAPAAGVTIDWVVTGDATLVPGGPTDAAGLAGATVTAGATPGPVSITATRADAPTVSVTFNLTVEALGTLSIIGGDGQTLLAGQASNPLEVELLNAAGAPIAGATVTWSTSAGSLAAATSVTNAAGVATNTVTVSTAGAVQVTASSPLAAAPAVFGLNGALSSLSGLNDIQREVAEALDLACPALAALPSPTPQQADLLARCQELTDAAGLDPAATIGALDELMADVALTQANAAFSALQSQFQNLKTRIAALRAGTQGTSFGGLALTTPGGTISLGLLASALQGDAAAGEEIGTDFSRWGFFAAGTIGRGEAEAGSVDPAYDYDIEGLTMGVDYRLNDRWIVGGSLGYTRQDTLLPGEGGGLDTTGWSVSAYGTYYQADSWYADGVITWGRNDYELLRRIDYTLPTPGGGSTTISQVAQADAGGDLLSLAATVGRDFNRGAWGLGPYARLLYTRVGFDAIEEELLPGLPGSGLGLRIESRDLTSVASVLGGKLTYTHSAAWGVLIPHLQLEWEHEFRDDPQSIEARFLHDPTGAAMVLEGDPLDTDYFRIGLGLSMVLSKGRSGFFYYERLVSKAGQSQYNLALGLRMEF